VATPRSDAPFCLAACLGAAAGLPSPPKDTHNEHAQHSRRGQRRHHDRPGRRPRDDQRPVPPVWHLEGHRPGDDDRLHSVGRAACADRRFHTRITAGILFLFTLATAAFFHDHLADQNQFIHFFKNVAIAGGLLNVLAFGGGRISLDGRRG
jgi:hypothetical protein